MRSLIINKYSFLAYIFLLILCAMNAIAMEKTRKFVISGPPGAGKSTLINFLAQEGILTIPEVYATVIREAISNGTDKTLSKDKTALYSLIIQKQLVWEDQLPVGSIAFLDRSIVDILLFISSYGKAPLK